MLAIARNTPSFTGFHRCSSKIWTRPFRIGDAFTIAPAPLNTGAVWPFDAAAAITCGRCSNRPSGMMSAVSPNSASDPATVDLPCFVGHPAIADR